MEVNLLNKMKDQAKRLLRPLARLPLIRRPANVLISVVRLPELRADYFEQKARQIEIRNDYENIIKSVPVSLRNITREQIESHNKLAIVSSSVEYLLGRVEFVRRELMYELRYGASSSDNPLKTNTEILNPKKLEVARSGKLLLNLGCGHVSFQEYINIDRRALPNVDIVAEADDLPFVLGEVDEIFSAHLLEHFPQEQLRRLLLPYWISLLKPGGVLRAVVPDAEYMIKSYASGNFPYASLREVTFGSQDYNGDFHYNMFDVEQVEELLTEAGMIDLEWLARGRENGACYEMEFRATKK